MKCSVVIDYSSLTNDDIDWLNQENNQEITFTKATSNNFLPPEVVLLLIELGRNIGYSAAYDMVKYILMRICYVINQKAQHKNITENKTFEIVCDDKHYSINCNFPLTSEQQDKLIDVAIEKIRG